jgi:quercetin dioxygenase-like cupin family protein
MTIRKPMAALAAGTVVLAAAVSVTVTARASAPAIPFPTGYRSWQHVRTIVVGPESPSFAARGGIHHYYANAKAVEGFRTGTFPNGSIIADEGVATKIGDGMTKGIVFEADRRSLDVMVKDAKAYKETAGWGYEHFDAATTPASTPERRAACFQCHSKGAERDSVFSQLRPETAAQKTPAAAARPPAPAAHAAHQTTAPDALRWSPIGPGLSIAVLSGAPQDEGAPFVMRVKLAAGSKVAPHWHPVDEHVTVVSGTLFMGTGERFDPASASPLTAGGYAMMPKTTLHFAWADAETIFQVHGIGPFKTNFVEARR